MNGSGRGLLRGRWGSKGDQDRPKTVQDHPKTAPRPPKTAQDRPKNGQERPKSEHVDVYVFFIGFTTIFKKNDAGRDLQPEQLKTESAE